MSKARQAIPSGHHTITPVLTLDNTAQAIDWYEKAFGASEVNRSTGPDGRVMHAEIQIGDSRVMLGDPMNGGRSPRSLGGSPAALWIYVENCDALFERALAAGARVAGGDTGRMNDQFWGDRSGTLTDPFGYTWSIATRKEDLSREELEQRQAAWVKQHQHGQEREPAHQFRH